MGSLLLAGERRSRVVQIRLLGGVSATDDGDPLDVGPGRCQAVLAALALSAGAAVPVWRLVELVWGETAPRTAEKTLQSYITRLRKGLGPGSIVRSGAAYRLDVDADSVDVLRFQRHLDAGDVEAALTEWTGPPLAGLDAGGLAATVAGLVEQWLGAMEVDLERLVETDAPAAIGPLTELTATHPFREGLWALLMTALYKVGRQAEALAAYRKAREHLVEQLGVEPGPRLRELERLILDQDEQLSVRAPSTGASSGIPTGTVTFGFSDIEGSARLWASHRQQTAQAIARHDELVRSAAADHDGYIFATGGDSFGVAFHRAGDAVAWATALQRAISSEPWPEGAEIRLRIGLHTGEAEERGDNYFGPAVNVASRIASAGHGGQTLVSGVTTGLLDGHVLRDLGTFRLGGVGADQRIFQLGDADHPPLRTEDSRRGNLPGRSGRLIGRDDDLEVIAKALADTPVVTLVGPGGIGKTRLALAAARIAEVDLGGGAWLVELADIASSADVPRAVADVLDVKQGSGRSLPQSIVTALQSRRALLVLDNCEHVVDGAAELARTIAEDCTDVRVLATSREGLGLASEQLIAVGPLDAAGPGVELFNERAAAADRALDPDASRDAVEEICRRLDGVPLAIELAAARTRSLSPADLVERLDDRLRLLTGGRRRSVERHRTLRATIQWSYDLLSPPEQMLFRRLSIFAGSFDLNAAETVASDAELDVADVDELLGDLVERSMVMVESGMYGRRFRLLETMRQFGGEHLSDAGESDLIAKRHAEFVLTEVKHLSELLAGHAEIEGATRLSELWPNLRAAVDWACTSGDLTLATALVRPTAVQGFLRRRNGEICDWAERILAMTPPDDQETIVLGLVWAALCYGLTHDREGYARLVEQCGKPDHVLVRHARLVVGDNGEDAVALRPLAVAEMRRRGEEQIASLFEIFLGGALLNSGRLQEADTHLGALADRFRAEGPPTFLNWTLFLLGSSAAFQGDHERAERLYEESASVEVPVRTNSPNETFEARTAFRRGHHSRAFQILRSYVDELLEAGNMSGADLVCIEFINMMTTINRLPDAARILGLLDTTGLPPVEALLLGADAADKVASNPEATAAREEAAEQRLDERHALEYIRDVLDELLDQQAAAPP
jgi:predicted ATPase/DNA-binding SARP family transcriptional activator/tetratricopeptide (TPR) repeat protein